MMGAWHNTITEPRQGICLHYDASASDPGAVTWLRDDPRCHVSYNWLLTDDGAQHTIAPLDARAWHAGVCRPSEPRLTYRDANSALYGIAIAATDGTVATQVQESWMAELCASLLLRHGWSLTDDLWRIVGHDTEAWPRGRKHDPTGSNPVKPVLSVAAVRDLVRAR